MGGMAETLSEARAAIERYKGTLKRAKEHTESMTTRALHTGVVVAAATATGAARKKWGDDTPEHRLKIPKTQIDADLALGAGAALAGIVGLGGKQSDILAAMGSGILGGMGAIAAFTSVKRG